MNCLWGKASLKKKKQTDISQTLLELTVEEPTLAFNTQDTNMRLEQAYCDHEITM